MGLAHALAAAVMKRSGTLTAWEADPYSPAASLCTHRVGGEIINNANAADALLDWCRKHGASLVVPTRHDDLFTLAGFRRQFEDAGVSLAISGLECIKICRDKVQSHAWLTQHGFPVPAQCLVSEIKGSPLAETLPLIAKHPRGSGSREVRQINQRAELAIVPNDWILQSIAPGAEHTVNVYVGRNGKSICEIPHARLMVGDGEVVRGKTVRNETLMQLARDVAESLPDARGPLNVQIFWDEANRLASVIEINPRFGGGYPLAERAGGHFAEWLLSENLDQENLERVTNWEDGLLMVRHREARFFRDA